MAETPTDQKLVDAAATAAEQSANGITSWSANGTSVSRASGKDQLDTLDKAEARLARKSTRMVGKISLGGW